MAMISNPITTGSLTEIELANANSAERKSIDILSTDCDTSTEVSVGGESSFWESSNLDDVTDDESGDDTIQFSGSLSDNGEKLAADTSDEHLQAITTESTDSGTEGNSEQLARWYELRSRKRKLCRSPAKCSRYDDSSDEEDTLLANSPNQQSSRSMAHGHGGESSGQGCGGRGRGGQGCGGRGRGGNGATTSRKQSAKKQSDSVPPCATPISTTDPVQKDSDKFCLLRDPGPHIPPGTQASALDLLELFFDNSTVTMDHILWCTYAYTESKKESKKGQYKTHMKKKMGKSHLLL